MDRAADRHRSSSFDPPTWRLVKLLGQGHCSSVYVAERSTRNTTTTQSPEPNHQQQSSSDPQQHRRCVLKIVSKQEVMKKQKLQRVKAEYEILSIQKHEHHPCLVKVLSARQTPQILLYELEYYKHGAFFKCVLSRMQMRRLPNESTTRFVAAEVILALEFLHQRGIIHRDVKPENLLVGENGHVALTDFDLAFVDEKRLAVAESANDDVAAQAPSSAQRLASSPGASQQQGLISDQGDTAPLSSSPSRRPFSKFRAKVASLSGSKEARDSLLAHADDPSTTTTNTTSATAISTAGAATSSSATSHKRTHSLVGTVEYMAPEVIADEEQSAAVDLWGLGVLLFECTFGITPFRGNDERDTMQKISMHETILFPISPETSPELRDFISHLLHVNPARRIGKVKDTFTFLKGHPWMRGVNFLTILDDRSPLLDIINSRPSDAVAAAAPLSPIRSSTDEFLQSASESLDREVLMPAPIPQGEFAFFAPFTVESGPKVRGATDLRRVLSVPGCGNPPSQRKSDAADASDDNFGRCVCPPRLWQLPWHHWLENLKSAIYLSNPRRERSGGGAAAMNSHEMQ